MSTSLIILISTLLALTLFSGCAQKRSTLACFKGSPACYTQQTSLSNDCPSCHAVII